MAIYIQRETNSGLSVEGKIIYSHALLQNIKTRYFSLCDIHSMSDDCTMAVGSVEAICNVLQHLNIPVPKSNYYPPELQHFLNRKVWLGDGADFMQSLQAGIPVFAKSVDWKQLTGQLYRVNEPLPDIKADIPLWFSEPIHFQVEYRVYVLDQHILAVCPYSGDDNISLDMDTVREGVVCLGISPGTPCAYAIDWGVDSEGRTSLVELNDGWAIGAYSGISPADYYRVLKARWKQLENSFHSSHH